MCEGCGNLRVRRHVDRRSRWLLSHRGRTHSGFFTLLKKLSGSLFRWYNCCLLRRSCEPPTECAKDCQHHKHHQAYPDVVKAILLSEAHHHCDSEKQSDE